MIRFIKYFMYHWRDYTFFRWFWSERQEQYNELIKNGEYHYKNRFDFALRNALVEWKHRDRFSKRCTGDCENCKLKHC